MYNKAEMVKCYYSLEELLEKKDNLKEELQKVGIWKENFEEKFEENWGIYTVVEISY